MSTSPTSISGLIDLWDTIGDFASDVGVEYEAARQMRLRDSISPRHWDRVIAAATRKKIKGVDWKWLSARHASSRKAVSA
ncbi:hypothetical protein JZX87_09895 [Agrobacterium sp. Ap1]|uniref:hypothetical protein n=1 Tax=Agrobacterium sp. Ap1 TaxID=2815337 RepID=UPI001A8FDF64|nr:hypothetical protein [Agrobacterium sp. Ap1]MBO0141474.1 hypothetical protein [Agrobacterium sp. Ap1]